MPDGHTKEIDLSAMSTILVVDDDEEIRDLLARYLVVQGFDVRVAADHREMLVALMQDGIHLIVLDVMLPDGSGIDICRELRARNLPIAIILLTALKEEVDRVIGLEIGADDYLGKPFSPRELVARIRAVLRCQSRGVEAAEAAEDGCFRFDGFVVEPHRRRVLSSQGTELDLTAGEFDLLHALVTRPGRVLTRDQLLDLTQGREADAFDRSVDVLMSRLRRKLGEAGGTDLIKTIRKSGYMFAARVSANGATR